MKNTNRTLLTIAFIFASLTVGFAQTTMRISGGVLNTSNNVLNYSDSQDSSTTLTFSKIKLRYTVLARFEIE